MGLDLTELPKYARTYLFILLLLLVQATYGVLKSLKSETQQVSESPIPIVTRSKKFSPKNKKDLETSVDTSTVQCN